MTSLVKQYYQAFLAQGVCFGIGAGMLFVPSIAVVSTYFEKYRSFSVGVAVTGSSLGEWLQPAIAIFGTLTGYTYPKAASFTRLYFIRCIPGSVLDGQLELSLLLLWSHSGSPTSSCASASCPPHAGNSLTSRPFVKLLSCSALQAFSLASWPSMSLSFISPHLHTPKQARARRSHFTLYQSSTRPLSLAASSPTRWRIALAHSTRSPRVHSRAALSRYRGLRQMTLGTCSSLRSCTAFFQARSFRYPRPPSSPSRTICTRLAPASE
jgi:MFS family permease